MTFIRAKEIPPRSGNWYDYEVMTIHEGGKVRQKVIRYIGKSGSNPNPTLIGGGTKLRTSPLVSPTGAIVACKHCHSQNVNKFGTYKGIQRYWCKDCERKFVNNGAIPKMKIPDR